MKWEIRDSDLQRVYTDAAFDGGFSPVVVKAFRKRIQRIDSSTNEGDFGSHFERLKHDRNNQYSMRLDQRMRLILEFENEGEERKVIIVAIEDYHRRER